MLPNPWIILGFVVALAGAALGGYFYGKHAENMSWEVAVGDQKIEAANILTKATADKAAADLKAEQFKTQVEAQDAAHQQALAAKNAAIADLAGQLDRLRNAGPGLCGSGAVPGDSKPAAKRKSGPPAVSGPTPGSFRELAAIAASAVDIARRGETCREWALNPAGVTK